MAAFIAKQLLGSQLESVKGLAGDKKEAQPDDNPRSAEEEAELAEQRREEEERRRNKYLKMEQEREKVRQGIREKYKIEKKVEPEPAAFVMPDVSGSLNRQKKSPAQLAINTDEDEFNPMKMATDLFEKVSTGFASIPFPWK